MVNNRTLFIGDQIQGVTVVSIDASSATLVLSGQTNILTLR
jgi:sRNA-binding carbon storage regulator CsrA